MSLAFRSLPVGAVIQTLLVVACLGVAVLSPPANGAMLALPLTGGTVARTINVALDNGATVEGTGPAGLIVLRGERARLAPPLRALGIVLLAAPSGLCTR